MTIRTPSFWYRPRSFISWSLLPFSLLYLALHKIKTISTKTYISSVPVICIGNLVAGGSGKTPVALAIMDIVQSLNLAKKPAFLSRGYGGTLCSAVQIDLDHHSIKETGDEPRLLARKAPVIISRYRPDGAQLAEKSGIDLLVMDDGFQNPSLHKTVRLVVIDGAAGFGNGFPLPAGPLRQSRGEGFKNADAFIIINEDQHNIAASLPAEKPVFKALLAVKDFPHIADAHYVAFCGLGRPEKFRQTIMNQGLTLKGWHAFPDHYSYSRADLERLDQEANDKGARLLTTEKDAARLPQDFSWQAPLDIMNVAIEWADKNALTAFIKTKLNRP